MIKRRSIQKEIKQAVYEKCGKKHRFIDKGFGQTIGGVTDETDRCR